MPLVGLRSFLPLNVLTRTIMNQNCVNALSRAEIISTVPSGKPHKYWAREVIFARNCLTISKTGIFRPDFCLFDVFHTLNTKLLQKCYAQFVEKSTTNLLLL